MLDGWWVELYEPGPRLFWKAFNELLPLGCLNRSTPDPKNWKDSDLAVLFPKVLVSFKYDPGPGTEIALTESISLSSSLKSSKFSLIEAFPVFLPLFG